MTEPKPRRRIGRSVLAVFAGFVAIVALSIGTDVLMHGSGIFPPVGQPMSDSLFVLALAYRLVFGIAGSYITARLAPDRPMRHSIGSGLIGLVIATAGAVVTWNQGPEFGPHWYPISLIVTALPAAWAGAKLYRSE